MEVTQLEEDIAFIKQLTEKYPEMILLAGAAEATPEGNAILNDLSMVPRIFSTYDMTAIEGDRTILSLLLFKSVLENNRTKFPSLSEVNFLKLREFTLSILSDQPSIIEVAYYSLACNDLGKTQALVEENLRFRGRIALDHDQILSEVVKDHPQLFPGLLSLSTEQQTLYKEGLEFNFNLGQFVQGENLPWNLYTTGSVSALAKRIRLLMEVFDFAGVTGHVNSTKSLVMTDINCQFYLEAVSCILNYQQEEGTAIDTTEQNNNISNSTNNNNSNNNSALVQKIYADYIRFRAILCGLFTSDSDRLWYVKGRIAALSRSSTVEEGQLIEQVWIALSPTDREVLASELLKTGFESKAILIYYFPAVLANAIKRLQDFSQGLFIGLQRVTEVYRRIRKELVERGVSEEMGIHVENVHSLAKEMNQLTI